jgi:hypothetical protein
MTKFLHNLICFEPKTPFLPNVFLRKYSKIITSAPGLQKNILCKRISVQEFFSLWYRWRRSDDDSPTKNAQKSTDCQSHHFAPILVPASLKKGVDRSIHFTRAVFIFCCSKGWKQFLLLHFRNFFWTENIPDCGVAVSRCTHKTIRSGAQNFDRKLMVEYRNNWTRMKISKIFFYSKDN